MTLFLSDSSAERRRQRRVLAAVCMACAAMPMVFTGPAVALGAIAHELSASSAALAWVTNAFMLAFGSCLLAAGALADRVGRRRIFLGGAWLFLLASVAVALAPGMLAFNLLRGLQGLAGAAIFASGAAALAQEFDGAARTRAFSCLGTGFGIGLVLGPVAAGTLTAGFGWRAIFGLVALAMGLAMQLAVPVMRESRMPAGAGGGTGFDWPGAIVFTMALTVLTCAVLFASQRGWCDAGVLAGLVAAMALFGLFAFIERRARSPMLDLSLFRYRRFLGIQLLAAAPAYAFVVLLVLLPIRFAGIEGMAPERTGWLMAALSAPLLVLPLAAGRASHRWSPAVLCSTGLCLAAAGLLWLAEAPGGWGAMLPMLLIGIGISLPWGLMDGLAVSVVPPERAGMAAGIFSTTRVAGEGVALALVGSVLVSLIHAQLPAVTDGQSVAQLLSVGRLGEVLAQHAELSPQSLVLAYESAFSHLLRGLAAVTVLTAVTVMGTLGRSKAEGQASAPGAARDGLGS